LSILTKVIIGILTAANVGIVIMNGHLIGFHIWISYKGISTFDHIMFKREKNEKLLLLKGGKITKNEYEQWLKETSPDKIEKKSKIIL
jgi:hypothetical protein